MSFSARWVLLSAGMAVVWCWPAAAEPAASWSRSADACGRPGYSYAGFQAARRAHGVRAWVSALSLPTVASGHTAAWVGVGGPGAAGGRDAWIQIGLASFPEPGIRLYLEVVQPGGNPRYRELAAHVAPGRAHRLAVLEVRGRPSWWRAWVDGRPVSRPVHLPGSSGRWQPIATAESWDGGTPTCNRFDYRFARVAVAGAPGGAWRPFVRGYRFQDPGYRVVPLTDSASFLAQAAAP